MKHLVIVVMLLVSSACLLLALDPMTSVCSCQCQSNRTKSNLYGMNNYSNNSKINSFMEIRCINSTNSSDFVLGLTFAMNMVPTSYCNKCELPGFKFSEGIVGKLNILQGVESLKLELRENSLNITRLPDGFLSGLADLRIVSLERIGLLSVPQNLVWGSKGIIELNFNGNNLTTLPANLLKDNQSLRKLNLSSNNIHVLPDGVFSNLKKLVYLDLSNNHLTGISKELFSDLVSLKELNLDHNDLILIETNALTSLVALRIAKFSHNQLNLQSDVYDQFGQQSPFYKCNRIEELYFSHNNINEIFSDWTVGHFRLRKLDLSYNSLENLEIEDLQFASKNLHVNLTNNAISSIDLTQLEFIAGRLKKSYGAIIDLNFNPIFCDCKLNSLLQYINGKMNHTALDFITLEVQQLRCNGPAYLKGSRLLDIKTTDLKCILDDENSSSDNSCTLEGICDCRLRSSDQTLIINCSARNLTDAPEKIIIGNASHVEIDLSNNSLTSAPSLMKNGYEKVRSLNLAENQIWYVNENLISPNLKILKLNGNKLKFVNEDFLNKTANDSSISLLTLHDNRWKCDDDDFQVLLSFVIDFHEHIPNADRITCVPTSSWEQTVENITFYMFFVLIGIQTIMISLMFSLYICKVLIEYFDLREWRRRNLSELEEPMPGRHDVQEI